MKKQTVKKIIKGVVIFAFVVFLIQVFSPLQTSAATSIKLDWDNPNKSGETPYKLKTSDVLNSQMITQVVGCTGITDKVSNAVVNFAKDLLTKAGREKIKTRVCSVGKKLGVISVASAPQVSTVEIPKLIECKEVQQTEEPTIDGLLQEIADDIDSTKKREECLNGIAVTLARNQLTAMTRYTMNWVNTGFNGDPMYVRNITSFNNSFEKNVIETGVNILTKSGKAYPYGTDFSRSAILGYNSGSSLRSGATNFLDSLTSDLSNFVTDPNLYYSQSALEKANMANDTFANDFSSGGWDAYLALTQRDQNNPLGFTMKASEYLQDQQISQTENAKAELATNGGFLSQKVCAKWDLYVREGEPLYDTKGNIQTSTKKRSEFDKCAKFETTTPGAIIKDKVSNYVNSPERQLELVDTINESLNSLFSALITKFASEGLSSLGITNDSSSTNTDDPSSYGSNNDLFGNDNIDLAGLGLDLNSTDSTSGGYSGGSFDLTRDLGNTFIHTYTKASIDATWNALDNRLVSGIPELSGQELKMGVAPFKPNGERVPANVYYIVSTKGTAEIVKDGANNWEVGDRAFWNGEEWQNWKCYKSTTVVKRGACDNQTNPIKKRGVLQIQKDYIVAAKEFLSVLPTIMPKLGELDYCIPGPNPNWQSNAGEAEAAFTDLVGATKKTQTSKYVCPDDKYLGSGIFKVRTEWFEPVPGTNKCAWFTAASLGPIGYKSMNLVPDKVVYAFPGEGIETYDNYANIFKGVQDSWWNAIISSDLWVNLNTIKESEGEEGDQKVIDNSVKKVATNIKEFYGWYGKNMNNLYGIKSPMQTQYLENELTTARTPNPAWLPMASEGTDITKDIVSYNEEIIQTTADYENAIIKANANINKLEAIKIQVSNIIKAAQDRRDAQILASAEGFGLTKEQYLRKYAVCFEEENISFFEDLSLSDGPDTERCNDNMDNDLDGKVDSKDEDCLTVVSNGYCTSGPTSFTFTVRDPTPTCESRTTEQDCAGSYYYHSPQRKTQCIWTDL